MYKVFLIILLSYLSLGATEKPNILFIVSEDNGPELGCYGTPSVRTPVLDQLASGGVRFENAFVPFSVCSPSRASFYTGLLTHQNGHFGLATHNFRLFEPFPWAGSMLKEAGYRVGLIGKLHVNPESNFHVDYRAITGSGFELNGRDVTKQAEAAATFFNQGDEPFFLTVNYPDAHFPVHRQVNGLPAVPLEADDVEAFPWLGVDSARLRQYTADYYNCIMRLDTGIGMLLNELRDSGKYDNTLILYIGDHGAQFSRGKTSVYEAGLKIPLIVSWPENIQAGIVPQQLVSTVDILPTFLQAAGLEIPSYLPGKPLQSLLNGGTEGGHEFIYGFTNGSAAGLRTLSVSLRNERYKIIHNPGYTIQNESAKAYLTHKNSHFIAGCTAEEISTAPQNIQDSYSMYLDQPEYELYDLQTDPYEWDNLADDENHQSLLQEMKDHLITWQTRMKDPFRFQENSIRHIAELVATGNNKFSSTHDWSYLQEGHPVIIKDTSSKGLLAHYSFDESSGEIAADSSGNNYDATVFNSEGTFWDNGQNGNSFSCADGTTIYASTPTIIGEYHTISFWFNTDRELNSTASNEPLIGLGDNGSDGYIWQGYSTSSIDDETLTFHNSSTTVIKDTITVGWHHVAYVWDGQAYQVYLDGTPAQTTHKGDTPASLLSDTEFFFGRRGSNYSNDLYDDFRIYDISLSPAAINNLANFQPLTLHTVETVIASGEGTVSKRTQKVEDGADASVLFYPEEGYDIGEITLSKSSGQLLGNEYSINNISEDITIYVDFVATSYLVTFQLDSKGSSNDPLSQTVNRNESATAPTVVANEGWNFIGWDKPLDNIVEEQTITAIYEANMLSITFDIGSNGTTTDPTVHSVQYNQTAIAPQVTPNSGWSFAGWDKPLDNIVEEQTIRAIYTSLINPLPRYRLYNINDGNHHWTVDQAEYSSLIASGWKGEGYDHRIVLQQVSINGIQSLPLYRLYNPNSGEHHWTMSDAEYQAVGAAGWRQEGQTGFTFNERVNGTTQLYRLYNPNNGLHHYTSDEGEFLSLVSIGWDDEGINAWVFPRD